MRRIADLAETLAAEHGVDQGEMEDYLLEQLERLTNHRTVFDLFEDLTMADLTEQADGELRAAIADQFGRSS